MLGGVQIIWRKEIKPYTDYELWSRILTWDDKWIYPVTHFVQKGAFKARQYLQDDSLAPEQARAIANASADKAKELRESHAKKLYASAVSRVVCKDGYKVVKPMDLFARSGLLPTDEAELAKMEERRLRNLKLVQDGGAWDNLHATFFDCTELALGRYTDLLSR
jgi:hypothetical protein